MQYIWEYSDSNFESFLRGFATISRKTGLLWKVRDALYYAFAYRVEKPTLGKRAKWGIISWVVWLLFFVFCSRKSLRRFYRDADCDHHLLFTDSNPSHFETLFALLQGTLLGNKCVCWHQCLKPSQLARLQAFSNVRTYECTHSLPRLSIRVWCGVQALTFTIYALMLVLIQFKSLPPFARWPHLAEFFLQYFLSTNFWNRQFSGLSCFPARFYVTSEASPISKAFVGVARKGGGSASHYCHGLAHAAHQVTECTDLFAFTSVDAAWFQSRVPHSCTVHATGSPRINLLSRNVGIPRLRGPGESLRVLYFAQVVESPYTRKQRLEDLHLLAAGVVDSLNISLRIRPHPRESPRSLERAIQETELREYELSENSLEKDLKWADVCASSWSTANLDALACQRPTYWLNARNDRYARSGDFIDAGFGKLVTTHSGWQQELLACINLTKSQ